MLVRERGAIVSRDGKKSNVLKIKPPLIFNKENVDELMQAFSEVFPMIKN
jgi:4-aminobutyrate aminotransferase-like enzyme